MTANKLYASQEHTKYSSRIVQVWVLKRMRPFNMIIDPVHKFPVKGVERFDACFIGTFQVKQ